MQTHLVIGLGEVGSAIKNILKCDGVDADTASSLHYEVIHICFPWSDKFVQYVENYKSFYKAKLVVVHSSVPIGTCDDQGWVHSPVRGVHPFLEQGIRMFVKYFGGSQAFEAAEDFARLGIRVHITDLAKNTEALKLWDTTQYGAQILLEKQIKAFCVNYDLDFDLIYTEANRSYNEGYVALGRPEVVRPYLKHMDGPIGGHCVMPNALLLKAYVGEVNPIPAVEALIEVDELLKSRR